MLEVRNREESPVSGRFIWLLLLADTKTKVHLSHLSQNYLICGLGEHEASLEHLPSFLFVGSGCHWTLSRRKKVISGARTSKQGPQKEDENDLF